MQMSSLKSFVILDKDDEGNFHKAVNLALMLDRVDFSIDSYPINSKGYPLIRKALLRGKGKETLVDDDEEDVEDIGGVGGTPSSSLQTWAPRILLTTMFLLDMAASTTP